MASTLKCTQQDKILTHHKCKEYKPVSVTGEEQVTGAPENSGEKNLGWSRQEWLQGKCELVPESGQVKEKKKDIPYVRS